MKNKFNRILSSLLVAIMLFAAVAVIIPPISADAAYSSDVQTTNQYTEEEIKAILNKAAEYDFMTAEELLRYELCDESVSFDRDGDGVDDYVITQHPSETDCTPGTMVYTCTECEITKTVPLTSDNTHASITHTINEANKLVYTCTACNCTYTPGASVYLDGSSYDSIVGVGNAENFNTKEGTSQPIINAGAYELINNTGNSGNIELWVPGRTPILSGFSSENNSIGFVSFRINALTTDKFDFTFVDTSSEGSKWSPDWCITDAFFRVFAPKTSGGKTTVKITGWDSMELANIDVASNVSFTGWIDVKIYITMNSATDEIILDYYINGNHVGSASRELTTSTNAINSICISGSTAAINSGIKLDEIAIGYTPNGAWELAK